MIVRFRPLPVTRQLDKLYYNGLEFIRYRRGLAPRDAENEGDKGMDTIPLWRNRREMYEAIAGAFDHPPVIAEVGVARGINATTMLEVFCPSAFYLVDSWRHCPDFNDCNNPDQAEQQKRYIGVIKAFAGKVGTNIIRLDSLEAAKQMQDWGIAFDFIYLDARHDYEAIKADIAAWWPLVVDGGYLAGHDYVDGVINKTSFGVKQAVNEFAASINAAVSITTEVPFASWAIMKKEQK